MEFVEKKSKTVLIWLSYWKKKILSLTLNKNNPWDIKLAIVEETPNVEVSSANRWKSPV